MKRKWLISCILIAAAAAGTSMMAFSQDGILSNAKTVSVNREDYEDVSKEEQLAEIVEYYHNNMRDFNPEGEITSFEELSAYLDTLPGHVNLSDMEEGESRFVNVMDDGTKIYVKAVPSMEDGKE